MLRKSIKKITAFLLTATMLSLCLGVTVFANEKNQIPFKSYTYWQDTVNQGKTAVHNRPIYEVKQTVALSELGLESLPKKITDIFTAKNGETYVLDGGNSRVVILKKDYTLLGSFENIKKDTEVLSFTDAQGIFVADNGEVYIADTENGRVLVCDNKGNYIKEHLLPDSRLIPSNFSYRPIKVVKDSRDYLYVLSDGSYYGAILYSPAGEFLGFYGANTVKSSLSEVIGGFFSKLFMNNEKRAMLEASLPYQFTDLCVDKNDFIFTATGNTAKTRSEIQTGQIRRLNPGGSDVLNSDSINFGDQSTGLTSQDILGVAVDENGYIYALDSAYGHIFVYDSNNNTIGVFGSGTRKGVQDGTFTNAVAIDVNGEDVLVADGTLNSVSVFSVTEYGRKLKKAQQLTNAGDYIGAKPMWEELYRQDKQNQLIYIGLAKAYYDTEDYEKTLEFAKLGNDRETYGLAFGIVRNNFLTKYFTLLVIAAIAVIVLIILGLKYKRKKGIKFFPQSVRTAMAVMRHPSDTFADIKQKQKGSVKVAIGILLLYYVVSILAETYGGFCYTSVSSSFNALLTLMRTGGLVILFTVCFWAVSTLMHGQGKMKEIFIVVCYSFQPMIIANVIYLVLTNIMLPSEIAFLDLFMTVMTLYTAFLLCMGLMRICDYEFGRLIGVGVLSVAGIVIVLFVGIIVFLLLQLLWGFITTIYSEIYKISTFGG